MVHLNTFKQKATGNAILAKTYTYHGVSKLTKMLKTKSRQWMDYFRLKRFFTLNDQNAKEMTLKFLATFLALALTLVLMAILYEKTAITMFSWAAVASFIGCFIMMVLTIRSAFDDYLNK